MAVQKKLTVEATSDFNRLFSDLDKLKKEMNELKGVSGGSSSSGGSGVAGVASGFSKMGASIVTANQALNLITSTLGSVRQAINFVTKDFAFLEQRLIAFRTLTGSIGLGEDLFKSLKGLATETPISISESFEGAERLLAFGIAVRDVKDDLFALGNIAAGVGKEKLSRLILAFGQVKTATQLTGQELRQFAEAGVPLLEELAKTSTRSAAQIKADMFAGIKPTFEDVRDAIHRMNEEGGRFNNLLKEQANTVSGLEQITSDKFSLVIAKLSEATGVAKLYKDSLQAISDVMDKILEERGTDPVTSILDRSDRANSVILDLINKNNAFKGKFGKDVLGEDLSKVFGSASYRDLEAGSGALENINKQRLDVTSSIKTIEKTLEIYATQGRKGEEASKSLKEELKALKVIEKELAIVANSIEENLKKGRSELIDANSLKEIKFRNSLRGKSLEQIKEVILKKKEELKVELESYDKKKEFLSRDGRLSENEQKTLDVLEKKIKLLRDELKILSDRRSLLPETKGVNERFNSLMKVNPFENNQADAMTESMKRHIQQQELLQKEIRRINNATYLDEEEKDKLTKKRKEQLAEAQTELWKLYSKDALSAIGDVASVFSNRSKAMFNLSKLASIGIATMSAYSAINQVFSDPTLSTYEKYAHSAAIGLKTFANVAAIEKVRFGGGGSSSSASVSGVDVGPQTRDRSQFEAMSRRADVRSSSSSDNSYMVELSEQMVTTLKNIEGKE